MSVSLDERVDHSYYDGGLISNQADYKGDSRR